MTHTGCSGTYNERTKISPSDYEDAHLKLDVNQQLNIAKVQMRYKVSQEKSLPVIVGGAIINRLFLHCPEPSFFHRFHVRMIHPPQNRAGDTNYEQKKRIVEQCP
jgi:hypothetical protein